MKITLIHPSRNRPVKAFEAASKWIQTAGVDIEYILSVDTTDDKIEVYQRVFHGSVLVSNNRSAIDAINNAAKKATGDLLVVMSDDFDCHENWGVDLIKDVEGKEDFVLKTQDGIQKWMITLPIMDKKYYDRFGYIYHPDYAHMFCDTEMSCVADLTGRRLTSSLLFPHNHYSIGACEKDAVSAKADATWQQGEKLFVERARMNFGITGGAIQDQGMINWLRQRI